MISHTEPRKKRSTRCAICRQRPPMCRIGQRYDPVIKVVKKGRVVRMKDYDVCRQCWQRLTKRARS